MISKEIAAVFSLRVYDQDVINEENLPLTPDPWIKLSNPLDVADGFSYGVFRNESTGEVVISYRGTDGPAGMMGWDGLNNVALYLGVASSQVKQAAAVYAAVLRTFGNDAAGSNISFTGHSLGGGLASVMGVWFDRPAIVFDAAPFQAAAVSQTTVDAVRVFLGATSPQALKDYRPSLDFQNREAGVTGYFAEGEFLDKTRTSENSVYSSSQSITFGNQSMGAFAMHSQALLTAGLLSDKFRQGTIEVQASLPLIMSERLYSADPAGLEEKNFLLDLIRSEQSTPNGGKLTRFAADLGKLGTNLTGLNRQAQDALIAQGIEWYYWQGADYAGQEFFTQSGELLQYTSAKGARLEGALNKADLYVKPWLQTVAMQHGVSSTLFLPFGTAFDQWNVAAGVGGVTATARNANHTQIFIGQDGADSFVGGSLADVMFGGAGLDTMDGGAGDDKLYGGAGSDTYIVGQGKDSILDNTDGEGLLRTQAGVVLSGGRAAGKAGTWVGTQGETYSFVQTQAGDLGTLTIKNLGTGGEVRVEKFDLALALGSGYLGIQLDDTPEVALTGDSIANFWADANANLASLTGKASSFSEGAGKRFTVYLSTAAKAGETLLLNVAALAGKGVKAVLGDTTVDADGAVIALAGGQTQVSFSLVHDGELDADALGSLSVTYQGGNQSATSNSWGLTLKDSGKTEITLNGDILVRTESHAGAPIQRGSVQGTPVTVVETDQIYYVHDGLGNLAAGTSEPTLRPILDSRNQVIGYEEIPSDDAFVTDNTIFGTGSGDTINGMTGHDLIQGGGGNDKIDGGTGDDMLAGGAGNDDITGGEGNDYISSSADLAPGRQQLGPNDTWDRWGLPAGSTVQARGAMWGVYPGQANTIWDGIGLTSNDAQQSDTIDAGAGADWVVASWGNDRIQGGQGNDQIDGLAGDDIVEGGDGNDQLNGDGLIKTGLLNSIAAANHGADFIDGGEGADQVDGGGGADNLFGGAGNDTLFADGSGASDSDTFVDLAWHGADYIDGEDGDDYAEGGGRNDTVYGGAGSDTLWGDTSAVNLSGAAANDANAHGNDYLDGEDGDDRLVGGGGADTLYGGRGNDRLTGDESNSALAGSMQGADYLEGEDGEDVLTGGGGDDTLFGGEGTDQLFGDDSTTVLAGNYHGADYLDGGGGQDQLVGSGGGDTLFGGTGNDTLVGDDVQSSLAGAFHGADYLDGEDGDDQLVGSGEHDVLYGGSGNDLLFGDDYESEVAGQFHGNDSLDGGAGDDQLVGGGRDDVLAGGTGADRLFGDDSQANVAGQFHGADNLDGGTDNDQLVGGGQADTLLGGSGNDLLFGDDSQASLAGEFHGADTLDGQDGDDTLVGGGGDDILAGGAGDDVLSGDGGEAYVAGEFHGADVLDGGDGHDVLIGGGGNDNLVGGVGNDMLQGDATLAQLSGQFDGEDTIDGGDGHDTLYGQGGNDTLLGGAGDDRLDSGDGNDTLDGGQGDDRFSVAGTQGTKTILDEGGTDVLELGWRIDDIVLTRGSLVLTNRVTGQQVRVEGFDADDAGTDNPIEHYELLARDGSLVVLTTQELIERMRIDVGGTDGDDDLQGTAFADRIDGGLGVDRLAGGTGDDLYLLGDDVGDTIVEMESGGEDTVRVSGSYTLEGTYLEHIELTGFQDANATGNEQANVLSGNAAANVLDGQAGADVLKGYAGDDVYVVDNAGDSVYEVFDSGSDTVRASVDWTLGDNFEILQLEGLAANGEGNALDNTILGNEYGNQLHGWDGADLLIAGAGDDLLVGGAGADTLVGGAGADVYYANGYDFIVDSIGDGVDEVITNTSLDLSGPGLEHIEMATLDDGRYFYLFDAAEWDAYNLAGNSLGNVLTGNGEGNYLGGMAGSDVLSGHAGDDILDGGVGADTMRGGHGNDTYVVDDAADVAEEALEIALGVYLEESSGHDIVVATASTILGNGIEDAVLLGEAGIDATGNAEANTLTGNSGDNRLDGGRGADLLTGGLGDDVYLVDDLSDAIHEEANAGIDSVLASIDWILGGNIENLVLRTSEAGAPSQGTGNDLDNILVGHDGAVGLYGLAGHDSIKGGAAADWIEGGDGDDVIEAGNGNNMLRGDAGNDRLFGGADNDLLDGGTGGDAMTGGDGDDQYLIDSAGDTVTEAGTLGVDAVQTLMSTHTLGENFENLYFNTGEDATGTGNVLDNQLHGGWGNDRLLGLGGHDLLIGSDGADILSGGDGDDELDGGWGADVMDGGAGNDTYRVNESTDAASEFDGNGIDKVFSEADFFALGAGIEDLHVYYYATGVGNELDNILSGGDGDQLLYGLAGNDVFRSGAGRDTLVGGDGDDVYHLQLRSYESYNSETGEYETLTDYSAALELAGGGHDSAVLTDRPGTVFPHQVTLAEQVEDLDASALAVGTRVTGNSADNALRGSAASDMLSGGDGADRLFGDPEALDAVATVGAGSAQALADFLGNLQISPATALITWATLKADQGILDELRADQDPADFVALPVIRHLADGGTESGLAYWPRSTWQADAGQWEGNWTSRWAETGSTVLVAADGTFTVEVADGADFEFGYAMSNWQCRPEAIRASFYSQYGIQPVDDPSSDPADGFVRVRSGNLPGNRIGEQTSVDWPLTTLPPHVAATFAAAVEDAGADVLEGEAGNDYLNGGRGNDRLFGGDGSDVLIGGDGGEIKVTSSFDPLARAAGSGVLEDFGYGTSLTVLAPSGNDDYLDGGSGRDSLTGGLGDDTYVVDGDFVPAPDGHLADLDLCDSENRFGMDGRPLRLWTTDAVYELDGEGHDTVLASASVVLDNVETVILVEEASELDIGARTSGGSQMLIGNTGRNTLDGGAGADLMRGGAGDDTYIVDDTSDEVSELGDEGLDILHTTLDGYVLGDNVEALLLDGAADLRGAGNSADNILIGNTGNNTLEGGAGDDVLAGWRGDDLLLGGEGHDTYAFSRGDGVDVVQDHQGTSRLHFSGDILLSDLSFRLEANDLVITVGTPGSSDGAQVFLRDWVGATDRANLLTFCADEQQRALDESLLNQAPVAQHDTASVSEDGVLFASGNLLVNDSDVDAGDTLRIADSGARTSDYGTLTLAQDGSYSYALNNGADNVQALAAGQVVEDSFGYTVIDSWGASAMAQLRVTITGADEPRGKGKGNEGLGNGEDPPPPGHDENLNDGPGTSPGNPGQGKGKTLARGHVHGRDAFAPLPDWLNAARNSDYNLVNRAIAASLWSPVAELSNTHDPGGDVAFAAVQGFGNALEEQAMRTEGAAPDAATAQGFSAASPAIIVVDPWAALRAGTDLVISHSAAASNPIGPLEATAADTLLFAAIHSAATDKPSWAVG